MLYTYEYAPSKLSSLYALEGESLTANQNAISVYKFPQMNLNQLLKLKFLGAS